jgi:hypothetical protein
VVRAARNHRVRAGGASGATAGGVGCRWESRGSCAVSPARIVNPLAHILAWTHAALIQRRIFMRALLYIAILLIVIWAVARVVGWVAGAMLNILWIVALVLFAIWLVGLITGRSRV